MNQTSQETEKCLLKPTAKLPEESATEQAASVFDLTFDPKKNKNASSNLYPQILASLSAISIHLAVGIVVGFSAILIPQLEADDSEFKITKEEAGWLASLAVFVVPVAALFTGYLVDTIGRLNTIRLACIPYTIGWVLIATATNLPMMYAGRILTGFVIAMGPSPSITYTTEVARPDMRGSLICIGPAATSFAMMIAFLKGWLLNWRIVAWSSIAYCLIPVILMYIWAPESPSWLMSRNKPDRALKSLRFLCRYEKQEGIAERQLESLQRESAARATTMSDSTPKRFFKGFIRPTGYKPAMILIMLFFFQQFSGIYITIFYAVTFFQEVGTTINAYIAALLIGFTRMTIGLLTSYLLRRYGRRPLCIFSGVGMTLSLAISGYYTRLIKYEHIESGSYIPIVCLLLYVSLGVIGLMTIPWTMTAELFPMEIRGMAQGLIVSLAHVIMFVALKMYAGMGDYLDGSYGVQWFFAVMSFISVIFVYLFVPETHKKKLGEIQDYFSQNCLYISCKKPATPVPANGNVVV